MVMEEEKAAVIKRSNRNPEAFCCSVAMEQIIQSLPPRGYVFQPSDTMLITDYLTRKINNQPLLEGGGIIWDLHANIYTYNPLHLAKYHKLKELEAMFFFIPKKKLQKNQQKGKEANIFMKVNRRRIGVREPFDFWKSNGRIKLIQKSNRIIGFKKTFIFYGDQTTDWVMEKYTILKGTVKLDDWILCKVYRNEKEKYDSDCYSDSESDSK